MAHELGVTQAEAYEHLMQLSPFEVKYGCAGISWVCGDESAVAPARISRQTAKSEIEWVVPAAQDENVAN